MSSNISLANISNSLSLASYSLRGIKLMTTEAAYITTVKKEVGKGNVAY